MSAFPDDPNHFWRWLRANGHSGEDRFLLYAAMGLVAAPRC
jgi:uncharacterized NAD(P)/FAD-binding protein YdhS